MKVRIKSLKFAQSLVGKIVPTSKDGHAGRYNEYLLENMGVTINRGHGPDILSIGVEVKSRDLDATSPHTIADMSLDEIINTPYEQSHVYEKFQQQLRVHIKDQVIVSADVYDFGKPRVQQLIKAAYENAREQLIKEPWLTATSAKGKFYGYFEQCAGKKSYSFRLSDGQMTKLENMVTSTFDKFIEY